MQAAKAPPSSEHSKPATARASVPVNSNVAGFFLVLSLGPLVIVVSGGAQSVVFEASPGAQSWVSSPKPSLSASGSSSAEKLYLNRAVWGPEIHRVGPGGASPKKS